jgi:DNA (cytosine-5)-methyltransferase 1
MDTTKPVTHVSLCAGYGGIDLGLKRAIPNLRTIAFSEIEAFACANLVAKMEAGCLDAAPIWTDVKTFPWEEFRGKVDILSGGYPCQPFSAAGKRLGKDDPRHLWPWIADGIRVCRPAVCFFENVEGHISLGLREVIGELEEIGYRATWGIFSAAEVGAPHQRKRVFILAHREGAGLEGHNWMFAGCNESRRESPEPEGQIGGGDSCRVSWPSRPGHPQFGWEPPRVVADAVRNGRSKAERDAATMGSEERSQEGHQSESGPVASSFDCGSSMGDTTQRKDNGRESRDMGQEAGEGRCGDDAADSAGTGMADASQQHGTGGSAWTGRGEWSQCDLENHRDGGNGDGQTQPALGGNADGPASGMDYAELCLSGDNRTDELRLLGNGVVPATAERAFRILSARFIQ